MLTLLFKHYLNIKKFEKTPKPQNPIGFMKLMIVIEGIIKILFLDVQEIDAESKQGSCRARHN